MDDAVGLDLLRLALRLDQAVAGQPVGTVTANYRPAYDILVRPRGARTAQEDKTSTVQPDFLAGIYGGISMAQYRKIQQVPGGPGRCADRDGRLYAAPD